MEANKEGFLSGGSRSGPRSLLIILGFINSTMSSGASARKRKQLIGSAGI